MDESYRGRLNKAGKMGGTDPATLCVLPRGSARFLARLDDFLYLPEVLYTLILVWLILYHGQTGAQPESS
jgi:hypothetical protein